MAVRRRSAVLVAVWLLGALVATGTGLLAVRLVAANVGDPAIDPLSAGAVESALAQATPSTSTPTGAPVEPTAPVAQTPPPAVPEQSAPQPVPPPERTASFTTAGGSVGVGCTGPAPRLLYATPAPGWAVEEAREHEGRVEVRFRSDEDDDRLRIVCLNGAPVRE